MTAFCKPPSDHVPSRAVALLPKTFLKRRFNVQYDDPESFHLNFYSEKKRKKKTEIADQLALNHAELEGIDTDPRSLIESF